MLLRSEPQQALFRDVAVEVLVGTIPRLATLARNDKWALRMTTDCLLSNKKTIPGRAGDDD